jgi:hypothetical protein
MKKACLLDAASPSEGVQVLLCLVPPSLQNLSAPFIMQVPQFKQVLKDSLQYVDFLFGNEVGGCAVS